MIRSTGTTRALAVVLVAAAPLLLHCAEGSPGTAAAWNGPPFSADITNPREPTKPPTRVYLGGGKMRMESTDPDSRGALVLDPATHTVLLISDKDRMYIDAGMLAPAVASGFAPIMHFFRPVAGGDPCAEWNTTVDQFSALIQQHRSGPPPQFTCRSLGSETVDGRPAQKWSVSSNIDARTSTVWIDQRLRVISKSSDDNGQMEMKNIHEGPQPATLFAPPSGYRKLGLSEMLASLRGNKTSSSSAGDLEAKPPDTANAAADAANKILQKIQDAAHR
jgi:hypothetical protein